MPHFVFMEFSDERVATALSELRDALQPWRKSQSPVHITVRGPYINLPDPQMLRDLSDGIKGDGVRIIGAGFFLNRKTYSVFLRAESAVFRRLWWKPDFPSGEQHIHPHLTMFETEDRESALTALNFLKASRISILTHSVQLSTHTTGQRDLFGTRVIVPALSRDGTARDIVAIDEEVMPAAKEVGRRLALRKQALEHLRDGNA